MQNGLLRRARDIISVGIAAQLATFPIALYHFEQVSLASPLSGLFAIPLAAGILWTGMAIIIFGFLPDVIINVTVEGLEMMIKLLIELSSGVAQLSFSSWTGYVIAPVEAILFLVMVFMLSFFLNTKKNAALILMGLLFMLQPLVHRFFMFYPKWR